ncbi:hypothetical protein EGJ15_09295 [Pseudomonas sp. p99-361]|nr:hypothetical protein EGJ15_09295 [Pseudomonas sp. p99-361]
MDFADRTAARGGAGDLGHRRAAGECADLNACAGPIAGKPAPTGSPQPQALWGPVGAGLPAIGPEQTKAATPA